MHQLRDAEQASRLQPILDAYSMLWDDSLPDHLTQFRRRCILFFSTLGNVLT